MPIARCVSRNARRLLLRAWSEASRARLRPSKISDRRRSHRRELRDDGVSHSHRLRRRDHRHRRLPCAEQRRRPHHQPQRRRPHGFAILRTRLLLLCGEGPCDESVKGGDCVYLCIYSHVLLLYNNTIHTIQLLTHYPPSVLFFSSLSSSKKRTSSIRCKLSLS